MNSTPAWRPSRRRDLPEIARVSAIVHPGLKERPEVLAEKFHLFPTGCFSLEFEGALAGYAISHPWRSLDIPPLDRYLHSLPSEPACLYLHDVAILPAARGHRSTERLMALLQTVAGEEGLSSIALTQVYGTVGFWARQGFHDVSEPGMARQLASYGDDARYMVKGAHGRGAGARYSVRE